MAIAIGMGGRGNLLDDSCRFSWNVLKIYRMYFRPKVPQDPEMENYGRSDALPLGWTKGKKLKHLGGLLAGLFCILCIGGSFGGGNAFQVVQSLDLIKAVIPALDSMQGIRTGDGDIGWRCYSGGIKACGPPL